MKITRLTVREWAESIAIAFVVAMVIRHFVVEAFRIPTASMAPTLVGRERNGDRILVSKFQYALHEPQRWDIVVFKVDERRINYYRAGGTNRKPGKNGMVELDGSPSYINYVKRLVGRPDEKIQVIDGDVFINGKIARKPPHAEQSLLVPVMNDRQMSTDKFFGIWEPTDRDVISRSPDGLITVAGSRVDCGLSYTGDIYDRANNRVGDLKLAFRFHHTGGAGNLICKLSDEDARDSEAEYEFVLPLGKPGAVPEIVVDGQVAARATAPFTPTGEHLLEVSNIDARAVLRVDGQVLVQFENDESAKRVAYALSAKDGVGFDANGCDVTVRDVEIWRDVYYTTASRGGVSPRFAVRSALQLGDDEYFMMGDNSPNSFDGRNWGVVKRSSLVGEAFFVFWPPNRLRFVN